MTEKIRIAKCPRIVYPEFNIREVILKGTVTSKTETVNAEITMSIGQFNEWLRKMAIK